MSDDSDELEDLRRWVADAVASEAATSRSRARALLQQASEDATFVGTLVDLAERGEELSVVTAAQSTVVGRIAAVGRDFVAILGRSGRTSFVPHRAIGAVRSQPDTRIAVVAGERTAPLETSLAAVVSELAAERMRVHVTTLGQSVAGQLRASGDDVLVVLPEGAQPVPTYVPLASVVELAVNDLL